MSAVTDETERGGGEAPPSSPSIEIRNLHRFFGSLRAVDNVSFSAHPGQVLGFIGPNGAGKTTTIKILMGLHRPTSGTAEILGMPHTSVEGRARIGYLPERPYFYDYLTAEEFLHFYGSLYGMSAPARREKIDALLPLVQMEHVRKVPLRKFSKGMLQRVGLAQALIHQPSILILDEPTTGLDPQARHLIWDKMRELKDKDHTLILTTHYMEEAEQLCDMLAFMDDGKIIAMGRPKDLIREHLETNAIEIFIESSQRPKLLETFSTSTQFHADLGQRLIIYSRDSGTMLTQLHHDYSGIEIRSRLTNLEDVFLKLTGHQLRENA